MKKKLFASVLATGFVLFGCQGGVKSYPVDFVDRSAVFSLDKKPDALLLVVELDENGRLSLNKIETGTIDDVTELTDRLKAVFDYRRKSGFVEREVVIDPQGNVKNADLEKLIESLAEVEAAPIQVIKNEF